MDFVAIGETSESRAGEPLKESPQIFILLLSQQKIAVVDGEDFQRFGSLKWSAVASDTKANVPIWYAMRCDSSGDKPRVVLLHRAIMGEPPGKHIDHWDGDGLNCRRRNLRIATPSQNQGNQRKRWGTQSKYKGVRKHRNTWYADVRCMGERLSSGGHPDEESAARAYDELAKKAFGEFACLNFPEESDERQAA